jgi:hypothetical protein
MTDYDPMNDNNRPYGLDDAILKILEKRIGEENAIKKQGLLEILGLVGFSGIEERLVRLSIASMRKKGILIGSSNTFGYFMCGSRADYEKVRNNEFMSRVIDILETVRIMDRASREKFGEGYQVALFDLKDLEREFPELQEPTGI